jgi:hypothetical protein
LPLVLPPPPEGSNNIVPFSLKKTTLKEETRNFINDALKHASKIPQTSENIEPESLESEVQRLISRLPEPEIESRLSDVPVRSKGERLDIYLDRALPRYDALEKDLKKFELEELCEVTRKKIQHFYKQVATLRKLPN